MTLSLDLIGRTYTAEVLKTSPDNAKKVAETVVGLTKRGGTHSTEADGSEVTILHGRFPFDRPVHRVTRTIRDSDGKEIEVPRRTTAGRRVEFLYDVLVGWSGGHVLVAVPFHSLAEPFFLKADRKLSGERVNYEVLDITRMVMLLGTRGRLEVRDAAARGSLEIRMTRCQLAYSDPVKRTRSIRSAAISGDDLGESPVYEPLIGPVLDDSLSDLKVSPTLLGFELSEGRIGKVKATTDRHGNFKLWVSPMLRGVTRIFWLLRTLESLSGVVLESSNVPILQSGTIRGGAED